MEAPISASQGPMRSLPRKLDLLLSGSNYGLRAPEKNKIRLLQGDLRGLIDNYLLEPSEVESPSSTANSWMMEVRDLSYDIDDFIYELTGGSGGDASTSIVQKFPRVNISRFLEKLKRRQWVADEISEFRIRVKEAIRQHKVYLSNCKWRPCRSERRLPPSPCSQASFHLVGMQNSIKQLCGWLAFDEQPENRVASIVGTGGVGKTTLAKEVYRMLGGHFECLAFVRTSRKPDTKRLLASILSQVQQHQLAVADPSDVHTLVSKINAHLRYKTYLVVIDDLWALSTWDIFNHALPKGNRCSRILTTTEVDVIAQTCCADNFKCMPEKKEQNSNFMPLKTEDNSKYMPSKKEDMPPKKQVESKYIPLKGKNNPVYMPSMKEDNSRYIIKMRPLREDEARELFLSTAFGQQAECPQCIKEVSNEIIKRSGGFPLAINILARLLAGQTASSLDQWNYIKNSLSSSLTSNSNLEGINHVLNLGYDDLPHGLKACMLYLCLYEEDCVIWKDDLVKQWIAEGFICAEEGDDGEEVAQSYFDELVIRGMIQSVDINCNGEILSCRVHHMVFNFIRYKSIEENFSIAIDYSQNVIRHADKVRRLALHFSNVGDATLPALASMRLSKIRSVAFFGFLKCMPSLVEYRFLQVLRLKLCVDPDKMNDNLTGSGDLSGNINEPNDLSNNLTGPDDPCYNLTEISELFRLKYFHLDACHMRVKLPTQMQRLKDLVAWEIDAEVTAVPSDIVDLRGLFYLRFPSEAHLPSCIGRMTSLRTLGLFDLSKNSTETLMSLGDLTNLQDLRLTCSTLQSDNLEKNLECLGSIIWKLSNIKCVTLVPAISSHVNNQNDAGASNMSTSWHGFTIAPLPPALLQTLELSRRCCIFSNLPKWIKELTKLRILKIALRKVSTEDVVILKGLPSLTALSLFIWTVPIGSIIFDNEGFSVLKYFKFVCGAPRLAFLDGAMPNVLKLKQGFNANRMERYRLDAAGFNRLLSLNEISIKIGGAGTDEHARRSAQSVLTESISNHPGSPIINVKCVDWNFSDDDKKYIEAQKEICNQTSEKQDEHGIQEMDWEEDTKKQAHIRPTYMPRQSTLHLPNAGAEIPEKNQVDTGGYGEVDKLVTVILVLGDQIGSAIGGQIKLHKNFDKELKKMKMALDSVDADARKRSVTDISTLLWLKRLKDAMYAISDMIDEFEADTEVISQPSARKFSFKKNLAIMIPCITVVPKITMAYKMEKMREDLEVIIDQHKKFRLTEGTNANELKFTDIRITSSIMETQIFGRTEEKEEILSSLFDSMTEEITILPIYGIGGLGKTTLAKMIYNNTQFKEYSQVWVYVSQTFDLEKIGNSIISQLSEKGKESEYTRMEMIHKSLQKLLADKKILIVLDDLWEGGVFHLESLLDMLRVGKGGNVVVIVTTRDEDIAKKISTIKPYKLAPLTDDICWSIIKQKSVFESRGDKEQLEKIGKVIAMKCAGVALAAKSLGHMLQSMKFGEWESVRDSDIWNVSSLKDTSSSQVLASLKLSYSVMPSYLKLCFAYCAIFPKGHKIIKDDLIRQWVSLGFSTWQLGERYISQLLGFSFLEHWKSPSTINLYDEDITLLTMHDLVHDLARLVMDDEILVGKGGNTEGSWYHYALLDDCSKPLRFESSKIRALRFMDCDKIELHHAAFSSAKSLRVLDLSECIIHKLPDSIGVLKQLRYLNAPRVQDAVIPNDIIKLSKLLYLNLHGSSKILTLPESIGKIEGLAYLDLSGCSELEKLPESFRRLKELVHLDLSNCSCIGGISEFLGSLTKLKYLNLSHCQEIGEMPEALGILSTLEYLNLSFSSYLESCQEEVLGTLNKLEYLNLSSKHCGLLKFPEALGTFIQLKYLNMSGCESMSELPRSFQSLKNLVHLDLSDCRSIDCLDEALAGLSNLQHLNLQGTRTKLLPQNVTELRYLNVSRLINRDQGSVDSIINYICSNLSNLEHLDLSRNWLESIPESICNLRKLHTLNLAECYVLTEIPGSIGTMDSLKFLDINGSGIFKAPQVGSNAISLPHFAVQPGDGHASSNLVLLQHIDSVVLKLTGLENVKSVEEAQRINLMGKKKLEDLKLEWTREAKRFVDHKILMGNLVPPSTLKKLEIFGYSGVSFPAWLVLDQLPNLKHLVLRGMANLEEWTTSHSSGEQHVLARLEIHDCPMLRIKPLPPKATKWVISKSDNVLSSWEECTGPHTNATPSFSAVPTELLVENCNVPLHEWRLLHYFPGLAYLHIKSSVDLTGSSEVIQHLSSLKTLTLEDKYLKELPKWLNENNWQLTKLQLRGCSSMTSLPHWLGELTYLKILVLLDCVVLCSLPESIQQLTRLKKLKIRACPKLNHLGERVCLLPSSLVNLQILYRSGIKCFPEGMEQLTNLQTLLIYDCPDLKQWCELEENMMKLAHIKKWYISSDLDRLYAQQAAKFRA